ncbi:MAG: Nif3-like dinuclear metal center hexameric protein [Akkermansiaceae bacterium]|nr:Nif3-like dinuclear metal center hexameric protein [Akkermansiaceae bacterium]MDP4846039.1 Nif3-like dinuclear metal center hexameric protein [Akkermansiaceae bacterium]MDP4897532.1 Nif3-like dinuclear metal center hexameric protein [Akkermansiaceae bacterium]MDP4996843.1 Nif3-like dinuclear metal center hexameric protein [Akkermansiaceae bacterium]
MANLKEIVEYLDAKLRISEIKDYPGAMNGLQLENSGNVDFIHSAVDASLAVVEEAAKKGGLLLVHHGMFWQGAQPLTDVFYRKIKAAINGDLAIYSCHLPLDFHPIMGNNVLLAQKIGLFNISPALEKDGWATAITGEWGKSREELVAAVESAVGRKTILCPGGTEEVGRVAVVTGGAGSEVTRIMGLGVDAFVTGEGPHWSFVEAEERGMNLIYAGHYATETFGVERLGETLGDQFKLEFSFINRLGGL